MVETLKTEIPCVLTNRDVASDCQASATSPSATSAADPLSHSNNASYSFAGALHSGVPNLRPTLSVSPTTCPSAQEVRQ
jgi:hypothetical protein